MKTAVNIISIDAKEKKSTKSLTNINPNVSNEQLKQAAQLFTAIGSNTFVEGDRINRINLDEEYKGVKTEPTLSVSEDGTVTYNGDGILSVRIENYQFGRITEENLIEARNASGSPKDQFSGIIYAAEGTNYAAKSINFTVNK